MAKSIATRIHCWLVAMAVLASPGFALQGTLVKVGEAAPDFELSDSTGRIHKLSDFRGKSAVVLEFFRSGDW